MSKTIRRRIKGIKLREEPLEKNVKWYLSTEQNARIPVDIDIGDVLASGCVCDCEVIRELYAEKLANFLLREKELPEVLSFMSIPEEVKAQMVKQDLNVKKQEVRIPLEFKNLCEEQCPTLTSKELWDRTKAIMQDIIIRAQLSAEKMQYQLSDEELQEHLPFITERAEEAVKGFKFPEEAKLRKDGKRK